MFLSHLLELNDLWPIPSYEEVHVGMHRADPGQSTNEEVDALAINETADADNCNCTGRTKRFFRVLDYAFQIALRTSALMRRRSSGIREEARCDNRVGYHIDQPGIYCSSKNSVLFPVQCLATRLAHHSVDGLGDPPRRNSPSVAHADNGTDVRDSRLQHLIAPHLALAAQAKEAVVRQDGTDSHCPASDDCLASHAAQCPVAMDDVDAFADQNGT